MPRASQHPASRSCCQRSRQGTTAHPVLARTKCDQAGRFQIDVPAQKDPSKARFYLALWAYVPSAGLAGQAFATSAMPASGSVR